MTRSPDANRKMLEQHGANEELPTNSESYTNDQQHEDEEKQIMVTPKSTSYLSLERNDSSEGKKRPPRVQSSNSLLGLVGLEGHEDSEEDLSPTGMSAVAEEHEVMDITISPSSPSQDQEMENATCNTTPPGSVQGAGILSLSPPRLTTYSMGSLTSASVTDNFVLPPRPAHPMQRQNNHLPQVSPRFTRSPLVQQNQLQPRSRPPRAPHHHQSTIPGGAGANSGHTRTPTDATNYSFLSSLTDASGAEYSAPRRRTLSWDNNFNAGKGGSVMDSKSLGGSSATGSILQPILLPEEIESATRPPMSISASNLRKASPVIPAPTTSTAAATPPPSSRAKNSASLLAPSSLSSRDNLHPLIQKLQNISQTRSTSFVPPYRSPYDENNLHPLIQKLNSNSSPSKSGHTASTSATSPFTAHLQDEKKDDDSSGSRQVPPQPVLDRKPSDYASFSSSLCSSTTVSLQKKNFVSPGNNRGSTNTLRKSPKNSRIGFTNGDVKHPGLIRFGIEDVLDATRECCVETDIVKDIECNGIVHNSYENSSNGVSSFMSWTNYFLFVWVVFSIGGKGLMTSDVVETMNILATGKFLSLCLGLAAITIIKRKLSKSLLDEQVLGRYGCELSKLREVLLILKNIAASATNEEENKSDKDANPFLRFVALHQHVDGIIQRNSLTSLGELGTTREAFIESSQIIYERLAKRHGQEELTFERLCGAADLIYCKNHQLKTKMLSELLCLSNQQMVSKFDFVKLTDSIYKTAIFLIANINNTSRIVLAVDHIINVIFYAISLLLVPNVLEADADTLALTLLGILANFTVIVYFTCADYIKGIIRIATQKPYDIGDRIYFIKPEDANIKFDEGPPSGGWIVEGFDLYKTSVRQGVTGEHSTFANGSALLTSSRVVNWKRPHRANVLFSLDFPNKTGRDQISSLRQQISDWIEDRPREWIDIRSFHAVDVDVQNQRVKYNVIIRHRKSWHNYSAIQESKSDILIFLHELRKTIGG